MIVIGRNEDEQLRSIFPMSTKSQFAAAVWTMDMVLIVRHPFAR